MSCRLFLAGSWLLFEGTGLSSAREYALQYSMNLCWALILPTFVAIARRALLTVIVEGPANHSLLLENDVSQF